MILPISKAFHCLKARLDCIKIANFDVPFSYPEGKENSFFGEDYVFDGSVIPQKMDEFLEMFDKNLRKMREFQIKQKLALMQ